MITITFNRWLVKFVTKKKTRALGRAGLGLTGNCPNEGKMKESFNFRHLILITMSVTMAAFVLVSAAETPKLVGAFFVKGKVGLNWQPADGATEYSIHRKAAGEEYGVIGTADKTHHFDTDITPGATYTYKISANVGGEDKFSNEKSVTIPGGTSGDFKAPSWSGLRVDRNKIFLDWDNVPGAMAYNVYRSDSEDGDFEVVGNAQDSKYSDNAGLERGSTYYYALSALNQEFEETEYSETKSIKFGLSKAEMDSIAAEENKVELEPYSITLLFDLNKAGDTGEMNQPADVAVNSKGNIFITDVLNAKIHCFDNSGNYLYSFGEKTDPADKEEPPPGTFSLPFSLFIDKNDQVYVTDVTNHNIQLFKEDGTLVKDIRVNTEGYEDLRPNSIHVLDDGRIIITDAGNHRFLIIDQDGKILIAKGERGGGDGQFNFPDGITVFDNVIYVVDQINSRVQKFDLNGNFIGEFGSSGQTAGTFGRPKLIKPDYEGRLWVSDGMSHMIQAFTPDGVVKTALSSSIDEYLKIATPRGIFFKDGRMYIVNRVPNTVSVYKIG
jgi:sugar lactone lactonase YvrE/fibronectin type 3 domain-containing protein